MTAKKKDYSSGYVPSAEPPTRKPHESDASLRKRRSLYLASQDTGVTRSPIGVGPDYRVKQRNYLGAGPKGRLGRRQTVEIGPRYFTGAGTEIFGSMSPDDLVDVQVGLKRLGLIENVTGVFDGATKAAVGHMLGGANAEGVEWDQWLTRKVNEVDELGILPSGPERDPLTIQYSNPQDIRSEVSAQGTNLLGSSLAAGDPEHYVKLRHQQEAAYQTAQYNGDASATAPADISSMLREEHPAEYAVATTLGPMAQRLMTLLGSGPTLDGPGPA